MNKYLAGGIAGFAATVPMTAVMEILHRWPRPERKPLPPRQITVRLAKSAGLERVASEPEARTVATLASHFGYGAAAGAVYAPIAERVPGHPAVKGAAFGLLVWTLSYLGWLPATGVLRPATQHSARRNTLMIVAHLVWGATTGILAERLEQADEAGLS